MDTLKPHEVMKVPQSISHLFSLIEHRTSFQIGSIVKHKKYNFRGVVVGWDAFPRTDVSRWDGLQHIEGNVAKMPFYHVMADINDTETAFGHERPTRYVVQENLELCPENERVLEVYLNEDDGWKLDSTSKGLQYIAPDDVKVRDVFDLLYRCLFVSS